MMTPNDLLAEILFRLAHSCLNTFSFIQWHIINLKESAREIIPYKTSLRPTYHNWICLTDSNPLGVYCFNFIRRKGIYWRGTETGVTDSADINMLKLLNII